MKKHILIVEDEMLIAKDIQYVLEQNNFVVIGIAINANQAYNYLRNEKIDCVLLDINISGHISGIDVAHHINKYFKIPFIYLTSYNDNDTLERLKETRPVGYQMKPISEAGLITAIELYFMNQENDMLRLQFGGKDYIINPRKILYVQSSHVYTEIFLKDEKLLVRSTLKNFIRSLPDDVLVRINRTTALNPLNVESFSKSSVKIGGKEFKISKSYDSDILLNL